MSKRNMNNSILINFIRFILFSLYFFSQFISCQECTDSTGQSGITPPPSNDCRFSVTKNQWYKCYTLSGYGSAKTFFFITSNDECYFTDNCKKISSNIMGVLPTQECLVSCAKIDDSLKQYFIQYGDFCIYSVSGDNLFGQGTGSRSRDY